MTAVREPQEPVEPRASFTRTQRTSVAFSWRVRVALSALPLLPLAIFLWGGLGFGPITWPFMVLTVFGAAIWWPHVWTKSRVAPAPAPMTDAALTSHAPVDLFTWPQE